MLIMTEQKSLTVKILDGAIYFFMVIFLISLTNSIFANQVGYFLALILILIRYFITKENQFEKTGLELALVWYIAAEILSAVFSHEQGAAFHNVLKRALMIPLIYTAIAASTDFNRSKKYFKIYIGASLITVLIYIYFSYKFYISNLYGIEQSGPSLFQYPITAAEILSFTVVFLFAFFINEKTSLRNKIFLFAALVLSVIALVSTYKRTGWTGAAFGIFIILVIKKQWKIIIPLLVAGVVLLLVQKNISLVKVFDYNKGKLKTEYQFKTQGRAYDILPVGEHFYVSDYENGLAEYRDTIQLNKMKFESPAANFRKWKNNYYISELVNTRFVVFRKEEGQLKQIGKFLTPGFTFDYKVKNNFVYVLDKDSGLTVFRNPENLNDSLHYSSLGGNYQVQLDSVFMVLYSPPRTLKIYSLKNFLPGRLLETFTDSSDINSFYYSDGKILISSGDRLKLLEADSSGIHLKQERKFTAKLFRWSNTGNKLFAASLAGELYEFKYPLDSIEILYKNNLGFFPEGLEYKDGKLYSTYVKRSRLLSIFDLYNQSNDVRFELWSAGWKMFKDYPVFGVGDIDLQKLYRQYKHEYDKEIQGHMHNNFMHILVTLGLFGFAAFCFLLVKIFLIEWKIYKDTKGIKFISSYSLGAVGSYCAFLVSGMTELNFGDQEIITLVWFILGLNIALYGFYRRKKIQQEK